MLVTSSTTPLDKHPTLRFARAELIRYLTRMTGQAWDPSRIQLGLLNAFPAEDRDGLVESDLDDAYRVLVSGGSGLIAGANPRSVLFGVYRFLEENGCRWVRPGPDGDVVVPRQATALAADLTEKAVQQIRGFNDCGAYPLENILAKIEWAPKVGLNTFLSEFFSKDDLYNNHYRHVGPGASRSPAEIAAFHDLVEREIARRGMTYHAIGHGWTGKVCGLDDVQSSVTGSVPTPEAMRHHLALVNGARTFHTNGPVFTELCLSNPATRQRLAAVVADYAELHPQIDVLHVWASDSLTSNCECDRCEDRPSNRYIQALNEIDLELTRRGLVTRIGFLIYHGGQLLHPPTAGTIENPDRFMMMFAPISRDYAVPYPEATDTTSALPPYAVNERMTWTLEGYLASLEGWQRVFGGTTFALEYHFTIFQYFDPGTWELVRLLEADIQALAGLGLAGYVGCETVAASFPNNFAQYVKSRLLFDGTLDVAAQAETYYRAAYGSEWRAAYAYLEQVSGVFQRLYREATRLAQAENAADASVLVDTGHASLPAIIAPVRALVAQHHEVSDPVQRTSWAHLGLHLEYVQRLGRALDAWIAGDRSAAGDHWTQLLDFVGEHAAQLSPALDSYYLRSTTTWDTSPWYRLGQGES